MDKVIKTVFFLVFVIAGAVVFISYYFGDVLKPQGGIYLTENKGEKWLKFGQLDSANFSRVNVTEIKYNPKDERIMYAGTLGSGALKSVNGGENWIKLSDKNGLLSPRANVYSVSADYTLPDYKKKIPDRFYLAVYQNEYGHVFKTDDGGLSFKDVYIASRPKYPVSVVEIDPRNPKVIWAGTGEGLLMKSQDYGETWKIAQEFKGSLNAIIINPNNSSQLFVSTFKNGIYTSFDGGVTWTDESDSLKKYPKAKSVETAVRHPYTSAIYLGTQFGVLKSADGGISWMPMDVAFPNDALPVLGIAFPRGNSKEMYVSAKNYIYSTQDGGVFWKVRKLGAARPVQALVVDPKNSSRVLAGVGK